MFGGVSCVCISVYVYLSVYLSINLCARVFRRYGKVGRQDRLLSSRQRRCRAYLRRLTVPIDDLPPPLRVIHLSSVFSLSLFFVPSSSSSSFLSYVCVFFPLCPISIGFYRREERRERWWDSRLRRRSEWSDREYVSLDGLLHKSYQRE